MADLGLGILLDIVDDEWMRETLPDEDIPFPLGVAPATDDIEETNQEQPLSMQDKWTELGLHTVQ